MSIATHIETKHLKNSEIEISSEIPAEKFESYRARAVKKLSQEITVPGFRKGHVPESVLTQKVGEGAILEEMAHNALSENYPLLLKEHSIRAIGAPRITLTKLASGNPLGFKAVTAVLPEVSLPDYREIAEKAVAAHNEPLVVTDEETEKVVDDIRKNWSKTEKGDEKKTSEEKDLPVLTDEFVQKLGSFKTVDEFKNKIKENLREEKQVKQKEKRRAAIIDGLVEQTDISIPDVMLEAEKEKMLAQFKGKITQMGIKPEDYFARLGKTEEEVKKEWTKDARKKACAQLIIGKIAETEKIAPDEKAVQEATGRLTAAYADADPERARAYVEEILTNEKVFEFLEKISCNIQK